MIRRALSPLLPLALIAAAGLFLFAKVVVYPPSPRGALIGLVDARLVQAGHPTCKTPAATPAAPNDRCQWWHRPLYDSNMWLEPEAVGLFCSRLHRFFEITPTCAEILVAADTPPEVLAIFRETAARPCAFVDAAGASAMTRDLLDCDRGIGHRRLDIHLAIVPDLPGTGFVPVAETGPIQSVEHIPSNAGWF